MAAMQIRLNQKTVESMREFGKARFGDSTDDKIVWTLVLDVKRLEAENELLRIKLNECKKKERKYQVVGTLDKEQISEQLEQEIERLKGNEKQ